MDEPRPDELVMVGGLPDLIRPLTNVLSHGLRQLHSDLAPLSSDVSTSRRVHTLVEDLQAPLGLMEDLAHLAADDGPEAIARLTALLAQASTRRALSRLTRALAYTQHIRAQTPEHLVDQAPSAAAIADLMEAAAIVEGMARALEIAAPPVIVIVTTVGEAGWLGSKLRDG